MDQFATLLASHSLRNTTARQTVFCYLKQCQKPATIRDIITHCAHIDRVSVYRVLDTFQQIGILDIVHIGWKKRYELAEPFREHHHHLICERCQEIIAIDTPEVERYIHTIAGAHGYALTQHHLELKGICKKCQSQ